MNEVAAVHLFISAPIYILHTAPQTENAGRGWLKFLHNEDNEEPQRKKRRKQTEIGRDARRQGESKGCGRTSRRCSALCG